MKKQFGLAEENFNNLLNWFSTNREEAGKKYEEIRNGLIRFFYLKGCAGAEDLADEVINRVAAKLPVLDLSENLKPMNLFYGFASKVCLEYFNRQKTREIELNDELHLAAKETVGGNQNCLEHCLARFSDEDSDLIIEYFCVEKAEKIERRKSLMEKMQINVGAFQIRIHRLKKKLRQCVKKCAAENSL